MWSDCPIMRRLFPNNQALSVQVMEPEKCESWCWKSWSDIKAAVAGEDGEQKLLLPIVNLLKDHPDIESLVQT